MKKIYMILIPLFAIGMEPFFLPGMFDSMSKTFKVSTNFLSNGVTCFNLSYAIFTPLVSILFSHIKPKLLLTISLVVFIISNLIIILFSAPVLYFIGCFLAGAAVGIFTCLVMDNVTKLVEPGTEGKYLGITFAVLGLAAVISAPLAIQIADKFSWKYSIVLMLIVAVIGLIFLLATFPGYSPEVTTEIPERVSLLKNTKVLSLLVEISLLSFAGMGLFSYMQNLHDINHSSVSNSFLVFFWALGGMLGSYVVGKLIDVVSKPIWLCFYMFIILAISLALLVPAFHLSWLVIIFVILWGAVQYAFIAPVQGVLKNIVGDKFSTEVVSFTVSANYLGGALGTFLISILVSLGISHNIALYVCVAILVLGGIRMLKVAKES